MAWHAVRVVLLVAGCAVLPVTRSVRLVTFAVATISFPVLFDLNLGNISIVVFALSALAWRAIGTPIGAVTHAVLIALRFPFALYFIEWVVQRRWRSIVWTIVAGLGLIAITLPIVGLGTYLDYVTIVRSSQTIRSATPHNFTPEAIACQLGAIDRAWPPS